MIKKHLKKSGKIPCDHCGSLYHPYRSGEVKFCWECHRAARASFWRKTKFYTPKINPPIPALKPEEELVLKAYIEIYNDLVEMMDKSWNEMESELKQHFIGKDYDRKWDQMNRRIFKLNREAFQTISRTTIARKLRWSRPKLYSVVGPMVQNKILLRNRRGYLVPNMPFILDMLDAKTGDDAEAVMKDLGIQSS